MTLLTVYTDDEAPEKLLESEEPSEVAVTLKEIGVAFDQWPVAEEFAHGGEQQAVLDRYKDEIARVVEAEGYVLVDVTQLHKTEDPGWEELKTAARNKFLSEHTHDDDEVRFFVSGSGIFYLHVEGKVYAVLCEAGDMLSVPGGTTHWFDMGSDPDFTSVRFFHDEDGWVGNFTGNPLAERIPSYDEIAAARAARHAQPA
jgi:1,2-dihydroxy-3-keto-5-methylthiopentene dioxygenase